MRTYYYGWHELAVSYINGNISHVIKVLKRGGPADTLAVRERVRAMAGEEKARMFDKTIGGAA